MLHFVVVLAVWVSEACPLPAVLRTLCQGPSSPVYQCSEDLQCLPGVGGLELHGYESREELDEVDDEKTLVRSNKFIC